MYTIKRRNSYLTRSLYFSNKFSIENLTYKGSFAINQVQKVCQKTWTEWMHSVNGKKNILIGCIAYKINPGCRKLELVCINMYDKFK